MNDLKKENEDLKKSLEAAHSTSNVMGLILAVFIVILFNAFIGIFTKVDQKSTLEAALRDCNLKLSPNLMEGRAGNFSIYIYSTSFQDGSMLVKRQPLENVQYAKMDIKAQVGDNNPCIFTYLKDGQLKTVYGDSYSYN